MRRQLSFGLVAALALWSPGAQAQAPAAATDLDRFMATALQRRDIDKKTLSDYVLDEVETVEVLGPGQVPMARLRREYTWFVRDGFHIRSPLKVDGVPIPEADRRAYEERWLRSEESRRKFRTKREEKRAEEGKGPSMGVPSINEPRFVSESYFMDFKFDPGNYYLAGKERVDGHDVLMIDYLPTKLFNEDADDTDEDARMRDEEQKGKENKTADQPSPDKKADKADDKKKQDKQEKARKQESDKEKQLEQDIDRKMNKSSQVTLFVDPQTHQIVKYTFNNVWMDFLPAGWLVRVDDLRASMEMGQPFPGVWLPRSMMIHGGVTFALGPVEVSYRRDFSNYRRADVTSKVTVPKKDGR